MPQFKVPPAYFRAGRISDYAAIRDRREARYWAAFDRHLSNLGHPEVLEALRKWKLSLRRFPRICLGRSSASL